MKWSSQKFPVLYWNAACMERLQLSSLVVMGLSVDLLMR